MYRFKLLWLLLLLPVSAISAHHDFEDFLKRQKTYDEVVEHTYTTTVFHLPYKCKEKTYQRLCRFYMNYYASDFDNGFTEYIADKIDLTDDEVDIDFSSDATQEVYLNFADIKPIKIFSAYAAVTQKFHGESVSFTEVFNTNTASMHLVAFDDLFEDPRYAAMLCSNIIYDTYQKYGSPDLYKLKAIYEVSPRNYMLLPDGLMFYFTKGMLAPDEVESRVFIGIDALMDAKPKVEFFPFLNKELKLPPPPPESREDKDLRDMHKADAPKRTAILDNGQKKGADKKSTP